MAMDKESDQEIYDLQYKLMQDKILKKKRERRKERIEEKARVDAWKDNTTLLEKTVHGLKETWRSSKRFAKKWNESPTRIAIAKGCKNVNEYLMPKEKEEKEKK